MDKIKPTIIFLDNIERLGSGSWDVMKAIKKISILKNFIFILPMNIKKMKNNERSGEGEYPIEKYIDIKYYVFRQNYFGLLTSLGFNEEISVNLDELFSFEIEGQKLSIRELGQRLNNNEFLKHKDNIWSLYKYIYKEVWSSYEVIESFSVSYLKKINILNNLSGLIKVYNSYIEEVKLIAKLNDIYNDFFVGYRFTIGFDYNDHFKKVFSSLEELIENTKNNIFSLIKENNELINSIDQNDKNIKETLLQINNYKKSIRSENEKEVPVTIDIVQWDAAIGKCNEIIIERKEKNTTNNNDMLKQSSSIKEEQIRQNTLEITYEKLKNIGDDWKKLYHLYLETDEIVRKAIEQINKEKTIEEVLNKFNNDGFIENEHTTFFKSIIKKIFE